MDKDEAIFYTVLFILTPFAAKAEVRYCVGEDSKTKRGSTTEMKGCVIIRREVAKLRGPRCKILSEAESVSQRSPPQFAYSLAESEWRSGESPPSQSALEGERNGLKENRQSGWEGMRGRQHVR